MTYELTSTIFPAANQIPELWRVGPPIEQHQYLCNGEIRDWDGHQQDVLSPVCEILPEGIQQVRIGSYPMLSEVQSAEILTRGRTR